VRLVRDLNSQPNIIGDGINVAQRVMGFAQPGQILVSRSYYEVVSHISEGYSKLFNYEGSRTDKHVREHEVYSVGYSGARGGGGNVRSPAERARASTTEGKRQATAATMATGSLTWFTRMEPWLNNRAIALGTATLSLGAFALAVMVNLLGHSEVAALSSQPLEPSAQKKAPALARSDDGTPSAPRKSIWKKSRPSVARVETTQPEVALPAPKPEGGEKKESRLSPFSFFHRDKPAAQPEAPVVPAGSALITLAIAPWGEIYVDGDRVGVSPPVNEVEVAPGRRKIEIKNGSFPVYTQIVEVKADQKVRIKHKFD
jgi:hypothetical protein